jgi:BirA family biotin operon repressor/biotin-[acetyl-CoA-carboxylase] ligase
MLSFHLRLLAAQATTQFMGRPLVYAPRLASTQALVARLADLGWSEGLVVLAEEQTAGRGRQGRTWWAPAGQALLLSLLLRPGLSSHRSFEIMMLASLAAAEAIESVCAAPVALKWPNDLYIRGRKVGGILIETQLSLTGIEVERAIIGIGINVAVDFTDQPSLAESATSLHLEASQAPEREALLWSLLDRCEAHYEAVLAGHSCHAPWAGRLLWVGERVEVVTAEAPLAGVMRGVDEMGALLIERPDGRLETIWAGDVSLRRGHHSAHC